MRRWSVQFAVVGLGMTVGLAAQAADKPPPELKAVLEAQGQAIAGHDQAAFAKTFRPDAVIFLPEHAEAVATPAALAAAFDEEWVSRVDAPDKAKLVSVNAIALSADMALLSGEMLLTGSYEGDAKYTVTWNVRVTEVLRRAEDGSGPWLVTCAMFSTPREDKHVIQGAKNGYPDAWPAIPGAAAPDTAWIGDWLDSTATWKVAQVPWSAAFGSAPKEKAVGAKKTAKLVASWKKISFEIVGGVHQGQAMPCYWMLANVNATLTVGKKPLVVRFRLMLVMLEEMESGEQLVLSAHFAAP
jgi:ketosteroid isomerase-like protein